MRASVIVSELSHDKSVSMAALNGFIRELSSSRNRAITAETKAGPFNGTPKLFGEIRRDTLFETSVSTAPKDSRCWSQPDSVLFASCFNGLDTATHRPSDRPTDRPTDSFWTESESSNQALEKHNARKYTPRGNKTFSLCEVCVR